MVISSFEKTKPCLTLFVRFQQDGHLVKLVALTAAALVLELAARWAPRSWPLEISGIGNVTHRKISFGSGISRGMRREAEAVEEVVETLGKNAGGKLVTHRAIGAVIESVRAFIIRSILRLSAAGFRPPLSNHPPRLKRHITCELDRTTHILTTIGVRDPCNARHLAVYSSVQGKLVEPPLWVI